MESYLLHILIFLTRMVAMSNGALSPQLYWKSLLPNTAMPKTIRDAIEDKSTSTSKVKSDKWAAKNNEAKINVGYGDRDAYKTGIDSKSSIDSLSVGYGGRDAYKMGIDGKSSTDSLSVGYGGRDAYKMGIDSKSTTDSLSVGYGGRDAYKIGMDRKSSTDGLNVGYGGRDAYKLSTAEFLIKKANPNGLALYFLEKDIHPGKVMTLNFPKNPSGASKFLPRQVVEKIPFSSKKLPEILNRFSVKPGSIEAQTIESTLKHLEQPSAKGQVDFVATSLESMVDFVTSVLGDVEVDSTEVEVEVGVSKGEVEVEIPIQNYKILNGVSKITTSGNKALVCHKLKYPYALFYCHGLPKTRAYKVPLVGVDGTKAKAVALCHTDTSQWNPNHFAFQMLKIKKGTVPVCHFIPEDHIMWVRKN